MINNKYNHKDFEEKIYEFWLKNNIFSKKNKSSKCFSITLPPPNVTGKLHLGHAWDGAIQDCLIRFKRINGYDTCFLPGTDHAGISAQTKFEKILEEKGIKRNSLSDTEFLKQLKIWVSDQISFIHKQWAKLGLALDYEYESFTLDKHANDLIADEFKMLYKDKLIYQGYKLVNWDCKLQTAISDIEVIREETNSKLYYFKYTLENSNEYITIATTRPETMFGDVAVFVNPKDKRYTKLVGKKVINPINFELIPIMQDQYIDMEFGTGAMKCTPAHDFNDYDLAKKHNLNNYYSCFNENGTLNDKCGKYAGLDRIKARDEIVRNLRASNLLIKIEDHKSNIGYSERTKEIVEPLLSKQWFVKMEPVVDKYKSILAKSKVKAKIFPPKFQKNLNQWLNNIQDWCISRQLLWGHQIPVWYHNKTKKLVVGNKPKDIENYEQDKSVLDTWFSSGLWPLTTTKYNPKGKNLSKYYPISLLVTGYDILLFWVARMLFQCSYIDNSVSLNNILLHGLIRDEHGRKMSKSLNNGIDPMDVIDELGCDSLRMFLLSSSAPGEDLRYSTEKVKYMSSFCNKIWNIQNLLIDHIVVSKTLPKQLNIINKWILSCFDQTISKVAENIEKYNLVVAFKYCIDFIWETFANKYLEIIKPLLRNKDSETQIVVTYLFKNILVMFHPFAPFITEAIYQNIFSKLTNINSIMNEIYPNTTKTKSNIDADMIVSTYSLVKDFRIKNSIKLDIPISINIYSNTIPNTNEINKFLSLLNIKLNSINKMNAKSTENIEFFGKYGVSIITETKNEKTLIDIAEKRIKELEFELKRSNEILNNKNFIAKAPKEKVDQEKQKLEQYKIEYDKQISLLKKLKT